MRALFRFVFKLLTGKATFACGCVASLKGKLTEGEDDIGWDLSRKKAVNIECPRCAIKAAINCCFCDGKIYPGDPVALYHKSSEGINWEKATRLGLDEIGCLKRDCCLSGGFFAGQRTTNGLQPFIERRRSAVQASLFFFINLTSYKLVNYN